MKRCAFYVAPHGNDAWSGTLDKANAGRTDGPFATLERARDAVRELKRKTALPAGGVEVRLAAGDYVLSKGFSLTEEDSGAVGAPVVYRSAEGERARLLGGRIATHFAPVKDRAVLARLLEEARAHVLQADLKALGISDFGQLRSRGFGRAAVPAHMELFFGGKPMTLARWPNDGFTTIAKVGQESASGDGHGGQLGILEAGFHYDGDRPKRWKSYDNVWLHGYWAWDWANSYEQIDSIDTERRLIKTKPPYGNYGFKDGQRFFFLNVLEELDAPGEYYVDADAGMLYFWPPGPIEKQEALVSILEEPMVSMANVSHVRLEHLTFECTRHHGISISGGTETLTAGCAIRNVGNHGVLIQGGTNHSVWGCDISETGDCGVHLSGGDRQSLSPCNHVVRNSHFWHFSRWSRCYAPAVQFSGVGFRVSHNLMHDAPHTAILYHANDSVVEFNEIHHVTLETGDCGAIYTGRDFTARGNVIRHNFIHHTGGYGMGSMGVYLDDSVSGQSIMGNVFVNTTRAAFIGGGRDNVVENNIFIDCEPAVHVDGRGLDHSPVWHNMIYNTMKKSLEAMKPHEPPYSERYPQLKELDKYYAKDNGVPPEGNVIARNICVGGRWMDVLWHARREYLTIGENLIQDDPHFCDAKNGDFRLREDSPARAIGFQPIPVEQIGLVKDEYRRSVGKVLTRLELLGEPSEQSGAATIVLSVANRGDGPVKGEVELQIAPPYGARFAGSSTCSFSLRPGEQMQREFDVETLKGYFTVETFSDEPWLRPSRLTYRITHWPAMRLEGVPQLGALARLLPKLPPQRIFWQDVKLAEVWIGLAGPHLALLAQVLDPEPTRRERHWEGSCVEVFGAMREGQETGQVTLLPPAGRAPGEARVCRQGKAVGPSRARWQVNRTGDGYELLALIPFAELGIEENADSFLLELAVGIGPSAGGMTRYAALGGSTAAYTSAACFRKVNVQA